MAVIQGEQRYQLIKLTLDSGDSIETTAEHPFYIKGKGWNPANSLKVGEALQLHNGTTVVIKQIETGIRVEKVYNLTVANTHNYFVGEDGVLVHNCSVELLRTGGKNTVVNVTTKADADSLLKEAFPDYQKVRGVGPQDATGIRKKRKMDRFKQGGAYHKDYAIDSETGRVRGHGTDDAHGESPHINIKRKDGIKVIINIIGR